MNALKFYFVRYKFFLKKDIVTAIVIYLTNNDKTILLLLLFKIKRKKPKEPFETYIEWP